MAVGIAVCLLLGGLFLYLAARQYRGPPPGGGGRPPGGGGAPPGAGGRPPGHARMTSLVDRREYAGTDMARTMSGGCRHTCR